MLQWAWANRAWDNEAGANPRITVTNNGVMETNTADVLRPQSWDDFIGQEALKSRLQIHIDAARREARPLDHIFLYGPKGMGKTSLAAVIAEDKPEALTSLKMPMTEPALLRSIRRFQGGILFLDEIHALSRQLQEFLLPLIEDGYVQDKRGRKTYVPWLTVIAATTERDKVIGPLYDRFHIKPPFSPYTDDEMGLIVQKMAEKLNVTVSEDTAFDLGRATGGVPRIARTLVLAARDLQVVHARRKPAAAEEILDFCCVDPDGLSAEHVRYLENIDYLGGTAGQKNLEMMMQMPPNAIREIERLLVVRNLIEYTSQGRELTPAGYERLHPSKKG